MVSTLADILSNSSMNHPQKTAFKSDTNSLTFKEANERANRLAYVLIQGGVIKGDRVGICLHRCIESFVAVHAILKVGAIFVPLDVKFPAVRINTIVDDCQIKAVIASPNQERLLAKVRESHTNLVFIGLSVGKQSISWKEVFGHPIKNNPEVEIRPTDLAYIIYSSGSTGVPKGIVHTHASGMSYATESAALYGLNDSDVIGSHSTLSYDISTFAYFTSPMVGATTLVLSDILCMVPASLSAFIEVQKLTVWYSVPLALKQLLEFGALGSRNLNSIRWVLYGGEPLPTHEARALLENIPSATFCNVYGPAEVNQCSYHNFNAIEDSAKEIPLGSIWAAAEGLLLDDDSAVVEGSGQTGELVIHSSTMMNGYWKNDRLEDEIYYSSPASPTKKYYRTRDLVHRDVDGLLYFVGRKDRQVKIQGYRVELKEIEHQLAGLDYLKDWAAVTDKTSKNYAFIVVFVVLKEAGVETPQSAVQKHLKQFLPSYALPEEVIILDEIPIANSGKKDYKKLEEYLALKDEGEIKSVH